MKMQFKMVAIAAVLLAAVAFGLVDPVIASGVGLLGAVVLVNSTPIANSVATPLVLNKANVARGRVLSSRGICTSANGDSIASIYRFTRVKSNDLVSEVMLDNATWGAACTMDIGLYRTTPDGAAVVSVALFASAVDMNTANRALDVTRESGTITVANMEKRVWELLGLSADPQVEYDVCGTLVAAAAAGAACVTVKVIGAS